MYAPMRVSLLLTLLVFLTFSMAHSTQPGTLDEPQQDGGKKIIQEVQGRPDLPGDLMIGVGFSIYANTPEGMGQNIWRSKLFSVHYLRDLNAFGESKFSVHAGLGFSFERFAFSRSVTIGNVPDDQGNPEMSLIQLNDVYDEAAIGKTKLAMNYFEIPLEFRWRSNRYDPKKGVIITAGARGGYLFRSHTKVKYSQGGETKTNKQREKFNQNNFRVTAFGKIGYGNFGLFYQHSFTPQFKTNEGPLNTEMFVTNVGISFALF